MSLRCSLVGHDWGESEIERDRDEQGSEVVLTVREFEVCARCGERNLISENTEVTTLAEADSDATEGRAPEPTRDETGEDESDPRTDADRATAAGSGEVQPAKDDDADGVDADVPGSDVTPDADAEDVEVVADADSTDEDAGNAASAADDDAVLIDDAEGEDVATAEDVVAEAEEPVDDAAPDPHGEAAPEATGDTEARSSESEAAADDGVILDDDDGAPAERSAEDREHGEWPEHDQDDEASANFEQFSDAPDEDAGSEGVDAASAGEAASADEATSAGEEGESGAGAQTTKADATADEDGYDAELIDDDEETERSEPTMESPSGIKSAGTSARPGERRSENTELVCPNCSNTESADRTSLRAGDICPECRKGYLSIPGE